MGRVKSGKCEIDNEAGEKVSYTQVTSVDGTGTFSVTYPKEYDPCVLRIASSRGLSCRSGKVNNAVVGTNMRDCQKAIADGIRMHISVVTTEETIIRYKHSCLFSAWMDQEGELWPNGTFDSNQDRGGWVRGGNTHATSHSDQHTFGLGAGIYTKITHTRGDVVSHQYEKLRRTHIGLDSIGKYGSLLAGFNNMGVPERDSKEMPYTEDTAKFFYNALMGIAAMAIKFNEFFGDDDNVIKAIEAGNTPLIGMNNGTS